MKLAKNILFVHCGNDDHKGNENSLLGIIANIDRARFTPFILTNSSLLHEKMRQMGIHSELEPFSILLGWSSPRFNIRQWLTQVKYAKAYIAKANIDLIHVNSGAPCQWMYTVAKVTNTPMITQLHSDYSARERITLGLHHSPRIIAVSKSITHQLIKEGYPQARLSIVPNGIDVDRLEKQGAVDIKAQLDIGDDAFTFVTVCSLVHRKGVDRLLLAMRHLVMEYPHVHLVVIGNGPQREQLEQQTDYLYLSDNVHFVGEQRYVQSWLKGGNAFVSGARKEAFSLAIAEAALAGLPIIAPYEGGVPEILEHKKTAIFYKNTSGTCPILNAMRAVVKNPKSAQAIGLHAKEHILNNHTAVQNIRAIEKIYTKAMADNTNDTVNLVAPSWVSLNPIKTFLADRFA
ncbi:glycosyltransferase [Vibrio genomosp. F10]|uniref:glycosyltransferase n=1 Tax=Vibrio genomosp. F10 TaxID=723171 RepID=UPI000301FD6D|nr:glycosyltransferase [Vibrio genomosp. F10]OEE91861.1 hypothetical protein A1QK_17970 [Vibrio genomosp. F10 str. 9ZD137]